MRLHFHSILWSLLTAGFLVGPAGATAQEQATAGLTQYTFGTPSGDETEILAIINRARSNPAAEGQRLVDSLNAVYPNGGSGIDLNLLLSQFQSYPARPPLAFNAKLNASAAAHTADMISTGVQQHNSSDGTPVGYRINSFGYANPQAENIAGSANYLVNVTPWTTEGSYETDTASPEYGHRLTIMEPGRFGSVEVGVSQRSLGGWNTTDFGADQTVTLLTGVVFADNAQIGFYKSGEGVASVVVTAPGASSYYAVTVESGAYTLPLDLVPAYSASAAAPTVQVMFTDALGNVTTRTVTLTHTVGADGSAYINPQGQVRYDNAEADLAEPVTASEHPAFFRGEVPLGSGVYYLAFSNGNYFGYYVYLSNPNFVYHFDLGYEYVIDAKDGQGGVYLYDFTSGDWLYTSPSFGFPYLYDFKLNAFLYYYPNSNSAGRYNTDGVRYFYNFVTGKIVTR